MIIQDPSRLMTLSFQRPLASGTCLQEEMNCENNMNEFLSTFISVGCDLNWLFEAAAGPRIIPFPNRKIHQTGNVAIVVSYNKYISIHKNCSPDSKPQTPWKQASPKP